MHFYELEKSQGSPISSSSRPRGSAYGTEEEEVMEGRAPWAADTQIAANFHPPGARQKELPEREVGQCVETRFPSLHASE